MRRLRTYSIELILVLVLAMAVGFFGYLGYGLVVADTSTRPFSGERALEFARQQMEFGPRVTGNPASQRYRDWLTQELTSRGWNVVLQPFLAGDRVEAQNVIAISRDAPGDAPVVILGTHYDSRMAADRDPDPANRTRPTPGANRGASGPAVLLELARTLQTEKTGYRICLAFFDAAENGGVRNAPEWAPLEGSRYFVARLEDEVPDCSAPRAVVTIDAVGATDQLHFEQNSTPSLTRALRQTARDLGYTGLFSSQYGPSEAGDHLSFLRANVPAVHIFDSSYRYRYTMEDTVDKLRAEYFEQIGDTLKAWLEQGAPLQ